MAIWRALVVAAVLTALGLPPAQAGEAGGTASHFGPKVLSESDHTIFMRAFAAADQGDWAAARGQAAQGKDQTARDLVEWLYLLDDKSNASFEEIDRFLRAHPDWPRREAMLAGAERTMPESMGADAALTWYGGREPVSGEGEIRLGEALLQTGKYEQGIVRIRKGWSEHAFAPSDEAAILAKHGGHFAASIHNARLEWLLWNGDLGGAERQLARVSASERRLGETRIKLQRATPSPSALVAKLPKVQRADTGVLFDQARALRRLGENEKAARMLLRASRSKAARAHPQLWWGERHLLARELFKERKYKLAYELVAKAQLETGASSADAEFLAGWISLRFLKNAKAAFAHFQALAGQVGTPISRARGQYWLGRTEEARGAKAKAWQHYRLAAEYRATFYGQLALARIAEQPLLHIADAQPDSSALRANFEAQEQTRAMRVLASMGEFDPLRSFAAQVTERAHDAAQLKLVADFMLEIGAPALAIKAAKQASYNDTWMLAHTYPLIDISQISASDKIEPALVLAIIRQESEFDAFAKSTAGALGLMQLIPASAEATARAHGLDYTAGALIADPQYNMRVGQAHLADLLSEFNGSYVLAIASYNAGHNNVRKWIGIYGDPREKNVDPVDWLELIPFGETRNYVQRVLESIGIYRNRLTGGDQKLTILADLYRPRTPDAQQLNYQPPASSGAEIPLPKPSPRHDERMRELMVPASQSDPVRPRR